MQADPDLPAALDPAGTRNETPPDLSVFFVDLAQSEPLLAAEERRTPRLSLADEKRAREILDAATGRLWRASRIATRIVLERVGGRGLRGIPFQIEKGGRPHFGGGYPHFSVSHTGHVALIAVSRSTPVGVDIEEGRRDLKMSIERRQRLVAAAQRIGSTPPLSPAHDVDVLTAWVLLEAVAKASGLGIGRLLTAEGVVGGKSGPSAAAHALEVKSLSVGADHIAAIAAERLPKEITIEGLPTGDFAAFLTE